MFPRPYYHLPPNLKEEHQDVLIIYAEDVPEDKQKAHEIQETVNGFQFPDTRGKAVLFDEAVTYVNSHISRLDEALKFTSLTLVLYSDQSAEDTVNTRSSNAVLWHTIEERTKQYTFIPVIWKEGSFRPLYARETIPVDMRHSNWKKILKILIEDHLPERLHRQEEQKKLQQEYLSPLDPNHIRPLPTASSLDDVTLPRHKVEPSAIQQQFHIHHQNSIENIDAHQNNELAGHRHRLSRCLQTLAGPKGIRIAFGILFFGVVFCRLRGTRGPILKY